MAKIQFLTILLAVTCFLGGVVSVTDMEFEDLVRLVYHQASMIEKQSDTIEQHSAKVNQLLNNDRRQSHLIDDMRNENKVMMKELKGQDTLIKDLTGSLKDKTLRHAGANAQNDYLEERVSLMESQVLEIEEDISDLGVDLTKLEGDVDILADQAVIKDERIFSLEQDMDDVDDNIEDLQTTTMSLGSRVSALEESIWNNSVAELEVRVETLEGTTNDHEIRLSALETDVNGLQMTDVELDARITTLEETGGADPSIVTVAFHTVLTSNPTIFFGSTVLFDDVLLSEGEGYDSADGTFTVPPDGDGYCYFTTYLLVGSANNAAFDIKINGELLCTAYNELEETPGDPGPATCSATTYATEGDMLQVVSITGIDTTPVIGSPSYYWSGFT